MNYVEQLAADIYVAVHGCMLPDSERLLYLFYAGLALAVGTDATPEQVHDAWSAWACSQRTEHPCLRPFDELAPAVRKRDEPYAEAIRTVMTRRAKAQSLEEER
jgi:hypothetical protein